MRRVLLISSLVLFPAHMALAQGSIQNLIQSSTSFINGTVIPFVFAIATLYLLVNVTRYFVISATDAYAKEQARNYAIYAVLALVLITSLWGVVNLVIQSFGVSGNTPICPDYNPGCDNAEPSSRIFLDESDGGFDPDWFDPGGIDRSPGSGFDPGALDFSPSVTPPPSSDNLSI